MRFIFGRKTVSDTAFHPFIYILIDLPHLVPNLRQLPLNFINMGMTAGLASDFQLDVHEAVSVLELVVVETYNVGIESCQHFGDSDQLARLVGELNAEAEEPPT